MLTDQQKANIGLWNRRDRILVLAERIRVLSNQVRDLIGSEEIINFGFGERTLTANGALVALAGIKVAGQDIVNDAVKLYDEFAQALPDHLQKREPAIAPDRKPGKSAIAPA